MSPDALLTVAEISIAVIGFAGIVSALRPPHSAEADAMHRLRLRLMIETSGIVMVFAFLPFLLEDQFSKPAMWSVASAVLAIAAPVHLFSIYARQRRLFGSTLLRETILFDSLTLAGGIMIEGLLIANASGRFFEPRFSAYFAGVLYPLATSVAMFVRAIFARSEKEDGATGPSDPSGPINGG